MTLLSKIDRPNHFTKFEISNFQLVFLSKPILIWRWSNAGISLTIFTHAGFSVNYELARVFFKKFSLVWSPLKWWMKSKYSRLVFKILRDIVICLKSWNVQLLQISFPRIGWLTVIYVFSLKELKEDHCLCL